MDAVFSFVSGYPEPPRHRPVSRPRSHAAAPGPWPCAALSRAPARERARRPPPLPARSDRPSPAATAAAAWARSGSAAASLRRPASKPQPRPLSPPSCAATRFLAWLCSYGRWLCSYGSSRKKTRCSFWRAFFPSQAHTARRAAFPSGCRALAAPAPRAPSARRATFPFDSRATFPLGPPRRLPPPTAAPPSPAAIPLSFPGMDLGVESSTAPALSSSTPPPPVQQGPPRVAGLPSVEEAARCHRRGAGCFVAVLSP
ncbi:vegetative cell wall protein gp1-like [Miscanthus floridulus]|uniref:vegetative cell wall protein gp1-like n=1 Tax=Miscanthus floridulus TaxID=154761 RepID=UPI00345AE23E